MAKNMNSQTGRQGRQGTQDMESNSTRTTQRETRSAAPARQARGQARQEQDQPGSLQEEILNAVQPAFQEVRTFVEASPLRAAAVGAVAGGLLMTLFSTQKGRAFVRMAYDYANPMVAKYAQEYISQAAGDFAKNAVSQH